MAGGVATGLLACLAENKEGAGFGEFRPGWTSRGAVTVVLGGAKVVEIPALPGVFCIVLGKLFAGLYVCFTGAAGAFWTGVLTVDCTLRGVATDVFGDVEIAGSIDVSTDVRGGLIGGPLVCLAVTAGGFWIGVDGCAMRGVEAIAFGGVVLAGTPEFPPAACADREGWTVGPFVGFTSTAGGFWGGGLTVAGGFREAPAIGGGDSGLASAAGAAGAGGGFAWFFKLGAPSCFGLAGSVAWECCGIPKERAATKISAPPLARVVR